MFATCCNMLQCIEPITVCCSASVMPMVVKAIKWQLVCACSVRSVLQCVAVCCSVLQCVAVCCSVWKCQCVANGRKRDQMATFDRCGVFL